MLLLTRCIKIIVHFPKKRYDTSTPGGDASHRDQDFGYEMIDESNSPMTSGAPQHLQQIPAQFQEDILDHASPQIAVSSPEEDSIADQYRGTPPMKSKKKKPDRRSQSHEVSDNVSINCYFFNKIISKFYCLTNCIVISSA